MKKLFILAAIGFVATATAETSWPSWPGDGYDYVYPFPVCPEPVDSWPAC